MEKVEEEGQSNTYLKNNNNPQKGTRRDYFLGQTKPSIFLDGGIPVCDMDSYMGRETPGRALRHAI